MIIKFRGEDIETKEWRYGYYIYLSGGYHAIVDEGGRQCRVQPESVGQFTGLLDKNGKEIYEDAIVRNHNGYLRRIMWIGAGFWIVDFGGGDADVELNGNNAKDLEVVGSTPAIQI